MQDQTIQGLRSGVGEVLGQCLKLSFERSSNELHWDPLELHITWHFSMSFQHFSMSFQHVSL